MVGSGTFNDDARLGRNTVLYFYFSALFPVSVYLVTFVLYEKEKE